MKNSSCGLLLLVLGLVIGFAVGSGALNKPALAQEKGAGGLEKSLAGLEKKLADLEKALPRLQISAYGYHVNNAPVHGYFVIDTVTGERWHGVGINPVLNKFGGKVR